LSYTYSPSSPISVEINNGLTVGVVTGGVVTGGVPPLDEPPDDEPPLDEPPLDEPGEECNEPGLSCLTNQNCVSCICVDNPPVCGDGNLDSGEQCENGVSCSTGFNCVSCQCIPNTINFIPNPSDNKIQNVKNGLWSESTTWEGGSVPGNEANVLIVPLSRVVYDIESTIPIHLIHIRGTLEFSRVENTELHVGAIILNGNENIVKDEPNVLFDESVCFDSDIDSPYTPKLEIGTFENPIPSNINAKIRLRYIEGDDKNCFPILSNNAGDVSIYGYKQKSWTRLKDSVSPGDNFIELTENVDWKSGQKILVVGTPETSKIKEGVPRDEIETRDFLEVFETEEMEIKSVTGNEIELTEELKNNHSGTKLIYKYPAINEEPTLLGTEVALLSRNIVIDSYDDGKKRGHLMFQSGSKVSIGYAAFDRLGKEDTLGRYALHFHLGKDTGRGNSVIGVAITNSSNRWVTIHGTEYILIKDTLGYISVGNGFFMEDGSETRNLFLHNLGINAVPNEKLPGQLLTFETNSGACFWTWNTYNAFVDNAVFGCGAWQYLFQAPFRDFNKEILLDDGNRGSININKLPFILFKDNNGHGAIAINLHINRDYNPSKTDPHILEGFTSWGSRGCVGENSKNIFLKDISFYNCNYWSLRTTYPFNRRIEGLTHVNSGSNLQMGQHAKGVFTNNNINLRANAGSPFSFFANNRYSATYHYKNYLIQRNQGIYSPTPLWTLFKEVERETDSVPTPDLTYYLHDYFGPGKDAKVIPISQEYRKDLNYEFHPDFGVSVLVAETNVDFPEEDIFLIDTRSPATAITFPKDGSKISGNTITVRGWTVDQSDILSVTVNGVQANFIDDRRIEWIVENLPVSSGVFTITAGATDVERNSEANPHTISINVV